VNRARGSHRQAVFFGWTNPGGPPAARASPDFQKTRPYIYHTAFAVLAPTNNRPAMPQSISAVALVVRDYDEALDFYVGVLGFTLIEDTFIAEQNKRWVVVGPPGSTGCRLLLARAVGEQQQSRIGNQTGGRVAFPLHTDDFRRDCHLYKSRGVFFIREPTEEPYGAVAVFHDLYGSL